MKILFISHYFQPEPNFFFGLPFAQELVRRGHQVQVLTGFPNYPQGKIYKEYRGKIVQREVIDDIPIIRVPLFPSHDRSSIKRIISYSSLSFAQAAIGTCLVNNADVAFVVQGPATIGLPSLAHKFFRRIPFVYNIQDLWPDSLASTGMFDNSLGCRVVGKWCNMVYRHAAKIAVIAPGMKQKLIERGVPESKIDVIYNWCDKSLIYRGEPDVRLKEQLRMTGKFNVVFAGNMGKAQAMDAVIDAASVLAQSDNNIQFVLIGAGVEVEHLKNKVQQLALNNVVFHGTKPINEIGPILKLADVLLVHLKDDPLFQITIPSKTQAYLATGKPVLIGVNGDAANLVRDANAGLSCQPENAQSIVDAVLQLYKLPEADLVQMGENAMKYYDSHLSFERAVEKYETVFNNTKDLYS